MLTNSDPAIVLAIPKRLRQWQHLGVIHIRNSAGAEVPEPSLNRLRIKKHDALVTGEDLRSSDASFRGFETFSAEILNCFVLNRI